MNELQDNIREKFEKTRKQRKIDNWYYWGRVDTNYEIANFGSAISSNTKIEIDEDFKAKGIRFRNENSYEISGSGNIIIESDKGNGIIDLKLGKHSLDVNLKLESNTDMALNEKTKLSLKEPVNLNKKSLSIKGKGSMQIENSFQMKGGIIIHDGLALVSFNSGKSVKLDGSLKFEPDSSIKLKEGLSFKLLEIKQAVNDSFNKFFNIFFMFKT